MPVVNRKAAPRRPNAPRGVARALAGDEARLEARRDRRRQEHEALLRAAHRVFLRRGYRQTRVDDVLREAGISTRAFYRFHASKDELFLELFDRANTAAQARLRATVARRSTAVARLDAYIDAHLDLAYDPRLRPEAVLFASVPADLEERYAREVMACQEQLVDVLREIVVAGRTSGELATAESDDAWALHGAIGAVMRRVLLSAEPPARAPLARGLKRFCRSGLGAA
jgi:AcrR family transcriptional regulator